MDEKVVEGRMKLKDLKIADRIIADDGFTCLSSGQVCVVHSDPGKPYRDTLFVYCDGPDDAPTPGKCQHFLSGQENEAGEIVGFRREAYNGRS